MTVELQHRKAVGKCLVAFPAIGNHFYCAVVLCSGHVHLITSNGHFDELRRHYGSSTDALPNKVSHMMYHGLLDN